MTKLCVITSHLGTINLSDIILILYPLDFPIEVQIIISKYICEQISNEIEILLNY